MIPILLSLGVLYLLALGAGRLSAQVRIPRVTGYLVVGLAAGPSMAKELGWPALITQDQIDSLAPLHDFVLGLIVLTIGGSFQLRLARKLGARLLLISAVEIGFTSLSVGALSLLVGAGPLAAGFLALMAVTTAPAATQMVMREYDSEGPLTDTVISLIVINNFVAIAVFIVLKNTLILENVTLLTTLEQIFGPIGLGLASGTLLALGDQRMTRRVERQILVFALVAGLVGACTYLGISPMLAVLVAGTTLVIASPHGRRMLRDLNAVDYPLYVLFFIMAGATLHLEHLSHMGIIGGGYVAARVLGKYIGCTLGARVAGVSKTVRKWLGPAMLAQAGLAIGIANALAKEWGTPGKEVQTVVLAAVVVFEIIGPLLIRVSLVSAGEVTLLNLLVQRSPVGYREGLHQVVNHFREALGIEATKTLDRPSDILVSHVMRRNVEVLASDTPFDEVLKTLGHTRYDRLPVVNAQKELVGVVQYSDISEVLFDPSLRNLVVAGDIATQAHLLLTPEDNLETAMKALKTHPDHSYLLVVEKENPKTLIGVVRHNDLLSVQRRSRR
jgi:Kef-type K+ transport system membrane component KefB/CBS domain-containing protein